MATSANVRKTPQGEKLNFFSRYFDIAAKGTDLFPQVIGFLQHVYCFPTIPIVGMVVKFLEQQQLNCVLVIPVSNYPWVDLASTYIEDLTVLSAPNSPSIFTVLNNQGQRKPKKFMHSMIAVKLNFQNEHSVLKH